MPGTTTAVFTAGEMRVSIAYLDKAHEVITLSIRDGADIEKPGQFLLVAEITPAGASVRHRSELEQTSPVVYRRLGEPANRNEITLLWYSRDSNHPADK